MAWADDIHIANSIDPENNWVYEARAGDSYLIKIIKNYDD